MYYGKYYDHKYYESVYHINDSAATVVTAATQAFQWDVADYGLKLTGGVYTLHTYLNIYNPSDEDKEVTGDLWLNSNDRNNPYAAKAHSP